MPSKDAIDIRNAVIGSIDDFRNASPAFTELLDGLQQLGTVVVFGGAARDWSHGRCPRDLDLVVDAPLGALQSYMQDIQTQRNDFGGYLYTVPDCAVAYLPTKVDIWALQDTWAFKTYPDQFLEPSLADLRRTVFFNIDAILVEPRANGFLDVEEVHRAFSRRELDVVFEPNPFPRFCVVKAFVHACKYRLTFSKTLQDFCKKQAAEGLRWHGVTRLMEKHWGFQVVSREEVAELLGEDFCFAGESLGTRVIKRTSFETTESAEIIRETDEE